MAEGAAAPAPFGDTAVPQPKSSAPPLPHFPKGENEAVEYSWVSIFPLHTQNLGEIMKIRNSLNPICAKQRHLIWDILCLEETMLPFSHLARAGSSSPGCYSADLKSK